MRCVSGQFFYCKLCRSTVSLRKKSFYRVASLFWENVRKGIKKLNTDQTMYKGIMDRQLSFFFFREGKLSKLVNFWVNIYQSWGRHHDEDSQDHELIKSCWRVIVQGKRIDSLAHASVIIYFHIKIWCVFFFLFCWCIEPSTDVY